MKGSRLNREALEGVTLLAACAFLLVLFGMLLARYQKFPYPLVDDAIKAARAVAVQFGWIDDVETGAGGSDGERMSQESGVTFHDPALASEGYTALTVGSGEEVLLLDMNGQTVHRWSLPVGAVREKYGDGTTPPDVPVSWRSFHMYPNGDLLVVLHGSNVTPYGLGIFKLDKESNLLWANLDHAHHDVAVSEDGLIYTISQDVRDAPVSDLASLDPPFLEDFVLVLTPDGRPVHRLSIMEAFSGTPFSAAVDRLVNQRDWKGDYFHVNAIEPYDSHNETAVLRTGQVLLSIRNMDALATMDMTTGKIVRLLRGSWHRQHDPDLVAGRIMLFDNRGDFAHGGHSRVIEFDPVTGGITWEISSNDRYRLYSGWGGGQQSLPSGNVLINEATNARLLEVTRTGEVAWEYYNARRDGAGYAEAILEARRYSPSYIDFEFNGL